MDKTTPHPLFKLATELGPLVIFFIANFKFHLFVATGAFMVAVVAAIIASYVVTRHVPIMALVTGVIVIVFGTLTLVLHDETFIKVKPTIIYGLFAGVLGHPGLGDLGPVFLHDRGVVLVVDGPVQQRL